MTNFQLLCSKIAAVPFEEKVDLINGYSKEIIPILNEFSSDGKSGTEIYMNFLICAVAADGRLAPEEFQLLKPMFDGLLEKDSTYEEACAVFKMAGLDKSGGYKKAVDLMIDLFGLISEDLKNMLVNVCLLVCAIDGEITADEQYWIKQLVDDNFGLTVMEQIDVILDHAGTFILATEDGGQPKMRVLGFKAMVDGKIYFVIGTHKDVYNQLQRNQNCEILATMGTDFLRWDGKAKFKDSPVLMNIARKTIPHIVELHEANGLKLAFFTLEGGSAEIVSIDNRKKKLF